MKTVSKLLAIDKFNDVNDEFEDAGVTLDEDEKFQKGNTAVCRIGLKGKRSGETRVRVGFFVADRIYALCFRWYCLCVNTRCW
ncbi:hypothetical protein [Bartonella sp. MU70NMGDW]|uniref:hypothetical protein n=1 Tax=Bartonella sp. MU70NMGDW TaxID=3243561 RepID=UPI0035CFBF86